MIVNFLLCHGFLFLLLFPKNAFNEPICPQPYSCILTKECADRHVKTGLQEVLFQCARKTKVCCPPVVKNVIVNPTLPETENENEETSNQQSGNLLSFTTHPKSYLLPAIEDCGIGNYGDKITEGEEAVLGEFPWMALLGFKERSAYGGQSSNRFVFNCGGTLINSRYILTAAHCTTVENRGDIEFVRLGEHNIKSERDCKLNGTFCLPPPVDIPIEKIITHPGWNATTIKNDIALLRLSRNAMDSTTTSITPICLPLQPSKLDIKDNTSYEVAGWGKTEWNADVGSDVLRKASIAGIGKDECNICKDKKKEQFCPITRSQICVQGSKSVDVCKGDSGGPLMLPTLNKVQIGITSFKGEEHCGGENIPSIFTNVTDYMPWILNNLEA